MESAAGILLYRTRHNIEFLLVNDSFSNKRHWTPPKGKLIGQEDELKCALRVVPDVTGLSVKDIQIEEGFRAEIKYLSGTKAKRAVFFLARLASNVRIVPGGLTGLNIAWMSLKQASEKAIYKNMQDVLSQAASFIEQINSRSAASTPDVSLPLNLQKLHLGRRAPGTNGRDSGDKHYGRRSLDEESRRPSSPARHRSAQDNRGLFLGPNAAKNWREPTSDAGDKQNWDEENANRGRTANSHASNPLYKTRLCERFETEGHCPYGNRCTFAHGMAELRERPHGVDENGEKKDGPGNALYKTRLCERFMKEGFCQYGPRCNFAHSPDELRDRPNQKRESDKDVPEDRPTSATSSPLRGKQNSEMHYTLSISRSNSNLTEPHQNSKGDAAIGKAATTGSASANPRIQRKDDKASLKDLLSGDEKNKPWMRVVQLSDDEKANLQNIPYTAPLARPQTNTPDTNEKSSALETHLATKLSTVLMPQHLAVADEIKELTRIEFKHDLSKRQVFTIFLAALLADGRYESQRITGRVGLLKEFVRKREDQRIFLKGLERVIGGKGVGKGRDTLGKCAVICKDLYDIDIVEEDVFLEWYSAIQDAEVKKKVGPFVEWLQTAEEEEED